MFVVQDVILKINQQYIASAAQDDKYRTEPPFKLQGSYRNMNKMGENACFGIESLQAMPQSPDPDDSIIIRMDGFQEIIDQGIRIQRILLEYRDPCAIVLHQSLFGREPHIAGPVLGDPGNESKTSAVRRLELVKIYVLGDGAYAPSHQESNGQ